MSKPDYSPIESPVAYEAKWARLWREGRIFEADPIKGKPKFFICVPYSYQNGPLHLGHAFTFTRGDSYARFKRMQGFNVLFPWSWHWTGEAVAGTSERLKRGDPAIVRLLRDIDNVPEELIPRFTDPAFICKYYTGENRKVVDAMGFSVDWRREFYTTDLHPYYSKFIQWQYLRLREKGFVSMGEHPVVWCPACQSATGDHDRLVGEGIVPEEYTLVFFECDGFYLAAGTLRPETVFGATNVWLNPYAEYVLVEYYGKRILVSRKAAEKLMEQKHGINILRPINAKELMGKKCKAPITGSELPILPAGFVDPNVVSGVVFSVPAHAPYDYAALLELQRNITEGMSMYAELLKGLRPISIISVPGYGDFPAVEVVNRMGISGQDDERLEEATREVYSKEFHEGIMKNNCGEYSGLPVRVARDAVKARLISSGLGDVMYDLPSKVVCRCGSECLVKVVKDQWFLTYSDPEWKKKVRMQIMKMNIFPEEARQWFLNVVDWLRDWACTRKTGLGTPLPWDRSWIVETLSDSTIYPALYTISKYMNDGTVKPDQLTLEVFDYVFLGVGDPEKVSKETGIPKSVLESMRDEFLYWYPVDCRISAKELVPNHLTFYIFHHVALFDEGLWPRCIGVNGMVTVEGEKMSKSKGNMIPIKAALAKYGVDATRCTLLLAAEGMDDPDWRDKNAQETRRMLDLFLKIVEEATSSELEACEDRLERWLISKMVKRVKVVTDAMESLKTRTACHEALYGMYNDWKWYVRRRKKLTRSVLTFLDTWVRLLAPFAPFTAEEAWSKLGNGGFVSLARWPDYRPEEVDELAEASEELIARLLGDLREIIEVTERKPIRAHVYTSSAWKLKVLSIILGFDLKDVMKEPGIVIKESLKVFPDKRKEIPSIVKKIVEHISSFPSEISRNVLLELASQEKKVYDEAKSFLESEIGCPFHIWAEDEPGIYDPMGKSRHALPLRPGIFVEINP
ncbi:MAG: leucine--tRNA ligase [Candidatus Terraquivivens tikiterensis]|uniref:Leucine--tRNA ligase n=1 Tax=Candidatus Terraquivivens tikiterensis TaxID=1980982 RepID=A0A2R7Y9M3_9ARCH|nr:MAG: leucine--tRNA ligase [Candidatus Terraquivivens tikiterensis]